MLFRSRVSRILFGDSITSLSPLQAVQLAASLNTLSRGWACRSSVSKHLAHPRPSIRPFDKLKACSARTEDGDSPLLKPVPRSPAPGPRRRGSIPTARRSEEHTSELQSLMRSSYAVFCLKKNTNMNINANTQHV